MLEVTKEGLGLVYEGWDMAAGASGMAGMGVMLDWTEYCCCVGRCIAKSCRWGSSWDLMADEVYKGGEGWGTEAVRVLTRSLDVPNAVFQWLFTLLALDFTLCFSKSYSKIREGSHAIGSLSIEFEVSGIGWCSIVGMIGIDVADMGWFGSSCSPDMGGVRGWWWYGTWFICPLEFGRLWTSCWYLMSNEGLGRMCGLGLR